MNEQVDIDDRIRPTPPPAINVPVVILAIAAVLIVIHGIYDQLLHDGARLWVLERFSFVPAFYGAEAGQLTLPAARFWAPFSYGFLHGDWLHLAVNIVWLVAFGTPVARRFGTFRFGLFFLSGCAAGAAAHYASVPGELAPLVGASGAVSACFGAATRFALLPGCLGSPDANVLPAASLRQTLTTPSTVVFIAVWSALNWLSGSGLLDLGQGDASIAWQAHVGGFLIGLLAFTAFDPPRETRSGPADGMPLGR